MGREVRMERVDLDWHSLTGIAHRWVVGFIPLYCKSVDFVPPMDINLQTTKTVREWGTWDCSRMLS